MKKIILTSLIATNLIACGGGSSDGSEPAAEASSGIEALFNIQGPATEPELSSASVTEGDYLTINSISTGTVLGYSSINLNFSPIENGPVLAIFSGSAEDLDIDIYDNTNSKRLNLENDISKQGIFFNATVGVQYTISIGVESGEREATFELKLVDANRASLNLADNEYAVLNSITTMRTCTDAGKVIDTWTSTRPDLWILNWKDGYMKSFDDSKKDDFISTNGNAVTIEIFETKTEIFEFDTDISTYDSTINFTTNFDTATITGTTSFTNSYVAETCFGTKTFTGKVVL